MREFWHVPTMKVTRNKPALIPNTIHVVDSVSMARTILPAA